MGGFNGSGTYGRYYNWVNDANNNIDITASRMDTEDNGFATGLSDCVTRDGQSPATAALPMGTFNHTNVGNATARNHYAAAGQVQDGALLWGGTAGGSATVITMSLSPAITAYATGQRFAFICGNTSTGAATINVNGVAAKTIKKQTGTGLVDIAAGDMFAGNVYEIIYDGTYFQLGNGITLPIWNQTIITASGNFTSPAATKTTTAFKITLVGGGAGGTYNATFNGGGGGAGGALIWNVTGLAASTTYAVVIGAGGASATAGGNSTIVIGSTTATASGGGSSGSNNGAGGDGGVGSMSGGSPTNYVLLRGGPGQNGYGSALGSPGGTSLFGSGGEGAQGANSNGIAPLSGSYGAAGGGASGSSTTGGAGFQGICIIEWVL